LGGERHGILLIVFLPLLAAIIAGLGNRKLGNTAKVITTGALFISCALSGRSSSISQSRRQHAEAQCRAGAALGQSGAG
jgi:NADH:ubiquinone oxidoreductase subunit 5 (subunit L)/multisubunit Na+/H+ antiporter MnhA subunit